MVSLKPTSLITAVIVITLIVLTIIDRVSSENDVKKCARFIKQLYRFRIVRSDDSPNAMEQPFTTVILRNDVVYASTLDDESIGIDPVKMFKKGFLMFNTTDIHLINSNILDNIDSTPDPQELKEIIKDMIRDYYANFDPSYISPLLERYSKEAEEESEPENLKMIVRYVKGIVSDGYDIRSDPAQIENLVSKMDEYTIGYFKELLNKVSIDGKENLNNPAKTCTELFPRQGDNIAKCTDIIKKKFKLDDDISGSDIFDILYKEWSNNQVNGAYNLDEEMDEMCANIGRIHLYQLRDAIKRCEQIQKLLTDSLQYFYKQFENILEQANFSHMPTPLEYCEEYIKEASTSQDFYDDYINTDATSIYEDFESLNI